MTKAHRWRWCWWWRQPIRSWCSKKKKPNFIIIYYREPKRRQTEHGTAHYQAIGLFFYLFAMWPNFVNKNNNKLWSTNRVHIGQNKIKTAQKLSNEWLGLTLIWLDHHVNVFQVKNIPYFFNILINSFFFVYFRQILLLLIIFLCLCGHNNSTLLEASSHATASTTSICHCNNNSHLVHRHQWSHFFLSLLSSWFLNSTSWVTIEA